MSSQTLPSSSVMSAAACDLAGVRWRTAKERLLAPRGAGVQIGLLVGNAAAFQHGLHPLINDGCRRGGGQDLQRFDQSGGKSSMRFGRRGRRRHLLGRLVLLRGGEYQRRIVLALGGRGPRLPVGKQSGASAMSRGSKARLRSRYFGPMPRLMPPLWQLSKITVR